MKEWKWLNDFLALVWKQGYIFEPQASIPWWSLTKALMRTFLRICKRHFVLKNYGFNLKSGRCNVLTCVQGMHPSFMKQTLWIIMCLREIYKIPNCCWYMTNAGLYIKPWFGEKTVCPSILSEDVEKEAPLLSQIETTFHLTMQNVRSWKINYSWRTFFFKVFFVENLKQ